eukprot:gb/GECH01000700.1/.p1 GENE.gb/GECH01000700.1/~~gb/GECH01000700.1/.p1  ORF type:complete len:353 (+),score=98.30 gb/GECH01000700.1/:1-1059(+)
MPIFTPPTNQVTDSMESEFGQRLKNKEYDEAIEFSDDNEIETPESSTAEDNENNGDDVPTFSSSSKLNTSSLESMSDIVNKRENLLQDEYEQDRGEQQQTDADDDGTTDSEREEEEEEEDKPPPIPEYDPSEYEYLAETEDLKDLFSFISTFKPHHLELETRLRPFIPDYIPATGEIDPFIKVPRPDGKPEYMGLTVLDEPAASQSDPTVVDLTLKYQSKRGDSHKPQTVATIEDAPNNNKAINNWITNVQQLHQSKPAPSVTHSKPMPDIESLMQVWPQEFEDTLESVDLPPPDVALSVEEYARLLCSVMDIPIHDNNTGSVVEGLYLAFNLYSAFKSNQHFKSDAGASDF